MESEHFHKFICGGYLPYAPQQIMLEAENYEHFPDI